MVTTLNLSMIIDSCVLIDYMQGPTNICSLIASHIGPIYVATPILDEVDSITSLDMLEELGLLPIEPELEDVFLAEAMDGQTSFQDNLCFLIAKREGFWCISNDKNLRKLCMGSSVPVLWGLELILMLSKQGGLEKDEAMELAISIHKTNPRHISSIILHEFFIKLRKLR